MKNSVISFAMVGALILLTSFTVTAQMGGGRGQGRMMGGPLYDTGTEVTINGTVDEVQQITATGAAGWSCPRGWTGTHLMLKTNAGTLPVHVGPSAYLTGKNFSIAKGDKVTILGSRVQYQGSDFLMPKKSPREAKC